MTTGTDSHVEAALSPEIAVARRRALFDLPYVLLVMPPLFWAGNFVLGRAVRADVPPVGLAFWRWAVGSLLIVGVAWPHVRREWPAVVRHWPIILLLSFLGVAVFNTLVYTALQFTTAINALLMQSTMPVLIVLLSYLFFKETISLRQGLGIALSLVGVVIIIARGQLATLLALSLNGGDLLVLVAVASYAAYSVFLRQRPALHPLTFLAVTFVAGTLMLVPFYLWEIWVGRQMHFDSPTTWLSVAYVAIFPSILAYLCYNRGVDLVGATRAGLFLHLMPVFGSLMAIAFLGEQFRLFHAPGIALILGGIALATRRRKREAQLLAN